jgi:hypothetical protein
MAAFNAQNATFTYARNATRIKENIRGLQCFAKIIMISLFKHS